MTINRRWCLAISGTLLFLGITAWGDDSTALRWDLLHVTFMSTGNILDPGGSASALAQDGSKITLTGSGTFEQGESDNVTGGGTWETFSPAGASTGTGTYKVKRLIRFEGAPGVQTSTAVDHIGDGTLKDNRAGLLAVLISYSDGSKGVLFVSCRLPGNPPPSPPPDAAPASIFEGVTASKGYTDYWNHVGPVAGVDSGRTLFHVLPQEHEG
jgi:hypothetical protein